VFVTGFPAAAFATNCFVAATAPGEECIVVDPGIGVVDRLAEILTEHRLRPVAVLLTHGHLDHVFSVTPVCGAHGVAATIHAADRYRLQDPITTLDPSLVTMFSKQFGPWREPDDVVELTDGQTLRIAGFDIGVVHAPGHTEGSVMFTLPGVPDGMADADGSLTDTVLSGDVLFAGSIGRTDLPGGDHEAMLRSLRDKVLTLPDETLVLPGHGEVTTIRRERQTNPFLLEVAGGAAAGENVRRFR
jgi:hydroxyacylglutathione hydrolase